MTADQQRKITKLALSRIVSFLKANGGQGQQTIANHFDISQQSVQKWIKRGSVPPERVLELVELGGGVASAHELAPKIFRADQ